ncbi:MAG TPA: hypothetical protein DCQ12_00160 [Candidatus Cloacimonas sp.]|jgi:DNA-directed RNA polymerase specialized sigma24 family protein|nr:hypothetical protein [Candidatus Cloacimonas sp.]
MIKSNESDNKGISQEQLEAINAQISALAAEQFVNLNLSAGLVEAAQMLLLGKSAPQDSAEITEDYITNTLFPRAVENVFEKYRKNCFRICLSKTQNIDLSEDIAQEAISLLLSSENRVENAGAWLAKVTYNLLHAHYKNTKKEAQLYERLSLEATTFEKWIELGDLLELKELDAALAEQLLKSDEYRQYQEIDSYNNIKDYAAANKISVATARKRKERARRNLKAKALRGMGWQSSPKILNFNQYFAIQKFIREVLRVCSGDKDVKWMKSLSREYAEAVKNIKFIAKWGISAIGNLRFRLRLFTIFEDGKPFMLTFIIELSKRNSISILDVTVNQFAGKHPVPDTVFIPKDKGKSGLTYEQIMSRLKGN